MESFSESDLKGSSSKRKIRVQDEHDTKLHHKSSSRERDDGHSGHHQQATAATSPKDEDIDTGSFDAPLYRYIPAPKQTTSSGPILLGHDLPEEDLPIASLPLTRGVSLAAAAPAAGSVSASRTGIASTSSHSPHTPASAGRLASPAKSGLALDIGLSFPGPSASFQPEDIPSMPPKLLEAVRTVSSQLALSRTATEPSPAAMDLVSISPVSGDSARLSMPPAMPVFSSAYSLASVQSAFDDTEEELKQEEIAAEAEDPYFSQSDDDLPQPMPGLGLGFQFQDPGEDAAEINSDDGDMPPMHPVLMRQAGHFFGGGGMGAPAPFLHLRREVSD